MTADAKFLHIETAAHGGAFGQNPTATPTDAQCKAGNYKLGRIVLYGLNIAIEQPRGTYRTGMDKDGKRWSSRMAAHYGYFSGTKGADGDGVDCFVGFYPQSEIAYVINQNMAGRFDETKVMIAFPDAESARRAYLDSYERGWKGLASIIPVSISQLKWWLKHGDMRIPLISENIPFEGLETMTKKVQWNSDALPYDQTLDQVLYDIRRADAGEGLLLDAVNMQDIIADSDGVLAFDALIVPFATLERRMGVMQRVMERAGNTVKPVALQVSEPFTQRGVANVVALFELSDGQTVSIYFHNPDVTPKKIASMDEVISWKWALNRKDITIVVAPERGVDLNVNEVARRIMKLAEKNSAAFQRANGKRAERMAAIGSLKVEVAVLEKELEDVQHALEIAKVDAETRVDAAPVVDPVAVVPPAVVIDPVAAIAPPVDLVDLTPIAALASALSQPAQAAGPAPEVVVYPQVTPAMEPVSAPNVVAAVESDNEQSLIDSYIKAWGVEAEKIIAAVAAVNWAGITDFASASSEDQKLRNTVNSTNDIEVAREALRAIGLTSWDSRIAGGAVTDVIKSHGRAMNDYRDAQDKMRAISKAKLKEAGIAELSALSADSPWEDAAKAIYRKHGIDIGIRSEWVDKVVTAINEKDAEMLRSILGNNDNKASIELFSHASGVKLSKTMRERLKQLDEWLGITPDQRVEKEADKDAAWQAKELASDVTRTWGWLESMKVRDGADVIDGQQFVLKKFSEGYNEVVSGKKGAVNVYGLKSANGSTSVKNKSFNAFMKAAMAFGGLKQSIDMVGAAIHELVEKTPVSMVDSAYQFASATNAFKEWISASIDKTEGSPFATAKDMDQEASRNGASIEWDKFASAVLDGADMAIAELERSLGVVENNAPINAAAGNIGQASLEKEIAESIKEAIDTLSDQEDVGFDENEIGEIFDPEELTVSSVESGDTGVGDESVKMDSIALDNIEDDGSYVGKIMYRGAVAGRVDINDDGSAMIYVGETGKRRVKTNGNTANYSDSSIDAEYMMMALFKHEQRDLTDAEKIQSEIDSYKKDKSDLASGLITPARIVGGGYKNGRKVAEKWLDERIAMSEKKLADLLLGGEAPEVPAQEVSPATSPAAAPTTTYLNGDAAEYTGKSEEIAGATFYEVRFTDGASIGKTAVTAKPPGGANPLQSGPEAPTGIVTPQVPALAASPITHPTAPTEDPQRTADHALFQSVVDGTVTTADGENILSPELANTMEQAYYRQQDDAELAKLFEAAVNAYQAAMMAATANLA